MGALPPQHLTWPRDIGFWALRMANCWRQIQALSYLQETLCNGKQLNGGFKLACELAAELLGET